MHPNLPLDILNNQLRVGDTVVFGSAGSLTLRKGKISKINPKTVQIDHGLYANGTYSTIEQSRRDPRDVVKVSE